MSLLEAVVDQANLETAWRNVKANRGAPGPDGITITKFPDWFRTRWPQIRQQLLDGTYRPGPVRRKTIDKPDGGQRLLGLLRYLRRTVYDDGLYEDIEQGIALGCPLSPLIGALFFEVLDKRMEALGLFYARFMDDWIVLAPTRWKLRRAVRVVNKTLAELRVEQPPPTRRLLVG